MIPGLLLAVCPLLPFAEESRFDVRISPVIDLWSEVRAWAEEEELPEAGPEREAIDAARALGEILGNPIVWGFVEGRIAGCERGDELLESLALLPEEFTLRTPDGKGRRAAIREPALSLGRAVVALEEDWLRETWPERRKTLETARNDIHSSLAEGREAALLARIETLLALNAPAKPIPVYLVGRAPWPGAVTHRTPGWSACFVSVEDRRGAPFAEVVLHEGLHAIEVTNPPETPSLFDALREAFRQAGVPTRDRLASDALHAILFLAAGEAVRTVLDPEHVDYAEAEGVWDRMGRAAEIVRPAWKLHVAGELDREALVKQIAEEVTRAREQRGTEGGAPAGGR